MGLCDDASVTFLKGAGYNVIRHPNASLKPLDLIGIQNDAPVYLGPLDLLITNKPGPLPPITSDVAAADINGQRSSGMKIGIGASILGSLIGAMGGNLGVKFDYTNARQITFSYSGVLNDSVVPLEAGAYLKNGDVDSGNLVLNQYVLGNGKLYLITKTAKAKKFTVDYEASSGVGANVDVPALSGLVGASLQVTVSGAAHSTVTFEGQQNLAFGFQCFQIGVKNGVLNLTSVQAGNAIVSVGDSEGDQPIILDPDNRLTIGF